MRTRILVLSVSAGAGHTRAAEALRAQAASLQGQVEVTHVDVLTLVPRGFKAIYGEFYLHLVEKHPALWAYLFNLTDRTPRDAPFQQMRRAIERLNTRALRACLDAVRPHHIVCTHFLPAELLAHEIKRRRLTAPVWVVVTDFDVHRLWLQPSMHGYFAATDEVAFRLRQRGIGAAEVIVSGIPIMPVFAEPLDRDMCVREAGLDPARPVLLLTSGGAGIGGGADVIERLLRTAPMAQIIALAGRNQRLLDSYQRLAADHPASVRAVGYTTSIERLMAASDVIITKPGGLTVSECLAVGRPMIVISPIPGQEERNADFLLEHGLALKANDGAALEFRVRTLLDDPARLTAMRERASRMRRPDAARHVLEHVLGASSQRL
jgi:processive 1,2-diacylglycerol beta-glucosyltransferase